MNTDRKEIPKRQVILDAARKVFDECGYSSATVDAVAATAGIAKGSIYNYFKSKEELFERVFNETVAGIDADILEIVEYEGNAGKKLDRALDYWFKQLGLIRQISRLVVEFWAIAARKHQGELAETFSKIYNRNRGILETIIQKGIETGEFRNDITPSAAAADIMGMLDGVQYELMLGIGVNVNEEFLTGMKRMIFLALRVKNISDYKNHGEKNK